MYIVLFEAPALNNNNIIINITIIIAIILIIIIIPLSLSVISVTNVIETDSNFSSTWHSHF